LKAGSGVHPTGVTLFGTIYGTGAIANAMPPGIACATCHRLRGLPLNKQRIKAAIGV
jgi:CO/xanthine dehydrogenase Mo-binding subunit